jgi:hypothetical protein
MASSAGKVVRKRIVLKECPPTTVLHRTISRKFGLLQGRVVLDIAYYPKPDRGTRKSVRSKKR